MLLDKASINYIVKPIWKDEKKSSVFNTKRPKSAENISMTWRKE